MALQRRAGPGSGSVEIGSEEELQIVLRALIDPRAFAPLYERYYDPVYRHCHRRLDSLESAQDAAGETFRKAIGGLAGFKRGSFRAWLFTIADHVLIDHYRGAHPAESIPDDSQLFDPAPDPESAAIAGLEAERLRAAIALLPDERRRVMELKLDGLRSVEIAQVLGRTPEWVRQNFRRGLKELAELLGWTELEGGEAR